MSSDIAISVKNLTKTYRLFDHPGDRIKQFFSMGMKQYHKEFTALKDVSFEIKKGETVGIIGRNGSGKSTLLQLICGILKPTAGEVLFNGRISALLELGSGFNPEFTGRENIYFQGAVTGFSKHQVDERITDIIAFADIGEFIDQPVRTYSSGMFVRLGFSVIAHSDAEILVVDEALAVGDAIFTQKCIRFLRNFMKTGTVLFVSHDVGMIQSICDRAILLHRGEIISQGIPTTVLDYYNALAIDHEGITVRQQLITGDRVQTTCGTGEVMVRQIELLNTDGLQVETIDVGAVTTLRIRAEIFQHIPQLTVGYMIKDRLGQAVFGTNTQQLGHLLESIAPSTSVEFRFDFEVNLGPGEYSVTTAFHGGDLNIENQFEWRDMGLMFSVVNNHNKKFSGVAWLPSQFSYTL